MYFPTVTEGGSTQGLGFRGLGFRGLSDFKAFTGSGFRGLAGLLSIKLPKYGNMLNTIGFPCHRASAFCSWGCQRWGI